MHRTRGIHVSPNTTNSIHFFPSLAFSPQAKNHNHPTPLMANVSEQYSTFDRLGDDPLPAPEVVVGGESNPGLVGAEASDGPPDAEFVKPKQDKEEVAEVSKGIKDGKEGKSGREDMLDRVNATLLLSVAAVAVVGAVVAIARKLRER